MQNIDRREFLKTTTTGLALAGLGLSPIFSEKLRAEPIFQNKSASSDRVNLGVIGPRMG